MQPGKTTSATTLRFFAEALEELGADAHAVLRRCEIDPAVLQDPEARIPQAHFEQVWKAARDVTGDPCIGLHAAGRIKPRAVNIFGYLMLSSATIGDGVRRIARYQDAVLGRPWISIREDRAGDCIAIGLANDDPEIRAIHAEYVAGLLLEIMSWTSERDVSPREVRFAHSARGDEDDYRKILRGPVRFECKASELRLAPDTLVLPSRHANPRIARLHEDFAAELVARHRDSSFAARVRRQIAERLESGPPDRSSIARRLGLSDRSLQRRLREEGTSFREVLDACRQDLARDQLEKGDSPIAEVAYLAGFAEASSFTRAVRRWFGCTPGEMRIREPSERPN